MTKAKFVGLTYVRGEPKDRWECSNCGGRFNLSFKKRGKKWFCRFCEVLLTLKSPKKSNK